MTNTKTFQVEKQGKLAAEADQPDTLYHLSRRTNRGSIKTKGLVPMIKEYKDIPREPGVFFFQTLEQAKDYGYWHAQFINQATDVWECHIPEEYDIEPDPHSEMNFANAWRSSQTLTPENLKFVGTILVPTSKSEPPLKSTIQITKQWRVHTMNISRNLNTADQQDGVTGYTSDVVPCRECSRPSNTLRKDSFDREGVFCARECAQNFAQAPRLEDIV